MSEKKLFVGDNPVKDTEGKISGEYVKREGETYYKIAHYDAMRPFFMTIVSAYDHWLFVSSNGGISAGRKNPDSALFPYYTDDKITDMSEVSGSKTILKIASGDRTYLWEPFSARYAGAYKIERNLYKNREGNKIIFEEINSDLGLAYSYMWTTSDKFGFVKKSAIQNSGEDSTKIEVLDGIQNILPYGVDSGLQATRSTLVDAYKKNEVHASSGMGLFTLSSMIVDKAEPSEALRATIAWSAGVHVDKTLLSSLQLDDYRLGRELNSETEIKADKGSFFIQTSLDVPSSETHSWYIIADINKSISEVKEMQAKLPDTNGLKHEVEADVKHAEDDLRKKVGLSDGIQSTADKLTTGRHFSNVLFNIMRGGTFDDGYQIEVDDLKDYVKTFNRQILEANSKFFDGLPEHIDCHDLLHRAGTSNDMDLERLCIEYLPLSFSRRHGDPSRPWNYFSIETHDEHGHRLRNYEGNWRDIFQNWEALAISYPEFLEGMITKFVNASTLDGYNPYRITRDGIDWEVIEPDDPWSYIGYWGDHQIIYLLKLMELSADYHPAKLKNLLTKEINVYANVPYKIRGFDAILMNPSDTIDYDHDLDEKIKKRVADIGSDGKMAWNAQGELVRANLTEKLLVTSLTKLYNFIPEAGIWLNTQRPEWNDANNALVGNGVSMVTLYYLRRFFSFAIDLFEDLGDKSISINKPVYDLMDALLRAMRVREQLLDGPISDEERRKLMERFGIAGEHYRTSAYSGFLGHKHQINSKDLVSFFTLANRFLEHSIKANRRQDGLYHSYNLLTIDDERASTEHLYEMLEGQVAVLSSKYLTAQESLEVLNALKGSEMFRADQYSYMLYPDRDLTPFLEKNFLDPKAVESSELMRELLKEGDSSLVERDRDGHYHFNGSFHNADDVKRALDELIDEGYGALVGQDRDHILGAFETVFNHKAFTGRSGTFYGYEGLGCIYWHMVSKLLLANQENIYLGIEQGASDGVIGQLVEHYYEIRAGIGVNKSPELYGAFPTDAYSHTPKNAGAQQPGMTGQVKEDVINRWAELGVQVKNGCISFSPHILRKEEFHSEDSRLIHYAADGTETRMPLKAGQLGFTFCQTPIVYELSNSQQIEIVFHDGRTERIDGLTLGPDVSRSIFQRKGEIEKIWCAIPSVLT